MKISPLFFLLIAIAVQAENWPQLRGPGGRGISSDKGFPVKWTAKDYAWRVKLPGITINGGYFVSLPGMGQSIEHEAGSHPALLVLATFMVQALGCELTAE